jgi:hypothetical protein
VRFFYVTPLGLGDYFLDTGCSSKPQTPNHKQQTPNNKKVNK